MLLGGTVAGMWKTPGEWEKLLIASRFRAVTAPFDCNTPKEVIREYCDIVKRRHVVIAEAGVWKNLLDPVPENAAKNLAFAKGQMALAEEWDIPCCVNIAGTPSAIGWDAADRRNFTLEVYEKTVSLIREIIDEVQPTRAFYSIEPMPWMVPDSPDCYLQLIRDVDRKQFAAHMDFVNMISCPRRALAPEAFIEECFQKLSPYIRSTHLKDSRMDPMRLTAVMEECSPGEGMLDFERVLCIMDKYLPKDAPVLLEHMSTFEEYERAYDAVAAAAKKASVFIG